MLDGQYHDLNFLFEASKKQNRIKTEDASK